MSDENTVYFRADGASLATIEDYLNRRRVAKAKQSEFAKRFGTESWFVVSEGFGVIRMVGLVFPGESPSGWRKHKRWDCHVPEGRKKEAKAILSEMESLGVGCIGLDGEYFGEGRIFTPGFEKLGDAFYIKQHEKAEPPPDAIPLKRSECWALKEAEKPE